MKRCLAGFGAAGVVVVGVGVVRGAGVAAAGAVGAVGSATATTVGFGGVGTGAGFVIGALAVSVGGACGLVPPAKTITSTTTTTHAAAIAAIRRFRGVGRYVERSERETGGSTVSSTRGACSGAYGAGVGHGVFVGAGAGDGGENADTGIGVAMGRNVGAGGDDAECDATGLTGATGATGTATGAGAIGGENTGGALAVDGRSHCEIGRISSCVEPSADGFVTELESHCGAGAASSVAGVPFGDAAVGITNAPEAVVFCSDVWSTTGLCARARPVLPGAGFALRSMMTDGSRDSSSCWTTLPKSVLSVFVVDVLPDQSSSSRDTGGAATAFAAAGFFAGGSDVLASSFGVAGAAAELGVFGDATASSFAGFATGVLGVFVEVFAGSFGVVDGFAEAVVGSFGVVDGFAEAVAGSFGVVDGFADTASGVVDDFADAAARSFGVVDGFADATGVVDGFADATDAPFGVVDGVADAAGELFGVVVDFADVGAVVDGFVEGVVDFAGAAVVDGLFLAASPVPSTSSSVPEASSRARVSRSQAPRVMTLAPAPQRGRRSGSRTSAVPCSARSSASRPSRRPVL